MDVNKLLKDKRSWLSIFLNSKVSRPAADRWCERKNEAFTHSNMSGHRESSAFITGKAMSYYIKYYSGMNEWLKTEAAYQRFSREPNACNIAKFIITQLISKTVKSDCLDEAVSVACLYMYELDKLAAGHKSKFSSLSMLLTDLNLEENLTIKTARRLGEEPTYKDIRRVGSNLYDLKSMFNADRLTSPSFASISGIDDIYSDSLFYIKTKENSVEESILLTPVTTWSHRPMTTDLLYKLITYYCLDGVDGYKFTQLAWYMTRPNKLVVEPVDKLIKNPSKLREEFREAYRASVHREELAIS